MTPPPPPPPRTSAGCGGEGCSARDPWPLHHVRHRSIFCRLCTTCVLKYNPSSFCSFCFSLLLDSHPPSSAVVHCATCPMVSHFFCLPNPNLASQFVCPSCENGEKWVLFPKMDGKRRVIDLESSRVLLAATRLAAESMERAAAGASAEVERKTKEAAVARKRAREMLERNIVVGLRMGMAAEETRRKKKRGKAREIEKWMRFHKMIPMTRGDRAEGEKEKLNGKKDEKEKLLTTGRSGEEEEKGLRLAQSSPQGALVSKTNPKSTFRCIGLQDKSEIYIQGLA